MNTVWVTTDGDYDCSSWPTGVWTKEQDAKDFVAAHGGSVEPMQLDCAWNNPNNVRREQFYCSMKNDVVLKEEQRPAVWVDRNDVGKATRQGQRFYAISYVSIQHARDLCEKKRQDFLATAREVCR